MSESAFGVENPAQDALASLGISPEEVDAYIEQEARAPLAKQICICGHPIVHHKEIADGRLVCSNAQMYCPCQTPEAVLVVQDTRYFARRTEGYGVKHALTRGLHALGKSGKWAKFLVVPSCKMCKKEEPQLLPTSVADNFRVSTRPEAHNVFLCPGCILILQSR